MEFKCAVPYPLVFGKSTIDQKLSKIRQILKDIHEKNGDIHHVLIDLKQPSKALWPNASTPQCPNLVTSQTLFSCTTNTRSAGRIGKDHSEADKMTIQFKLEKIKSCCSKWIIRNCWKLKSKILFRRTKAKLYKSPINGDNCGKFNDELYQL